LLDTLRKDGLERIDDVGVGFDPQIHDAVAHVPGDGDGEQVMMRCCAPAIAGRVPCCVPPWFEVRAKEYVAEREWFEKDYYKVLGLSTGATEKEITRAYRKLAKQNHPDTNPGSEEKFKEISGAYDVLGDATKRKEYDEVRRLGPAAAGFGTPAGGAGRFQLHRRRRRPRRHLRWSLRWRTTQSSPTRRRPRDGAAHRFSRRRRGRHDDGQLAEQRRLSHVRRPRRRARYGLRHLRALPRQGHDQRRSGSLRHVEHLSGLSGSRRAHRNAVPHLSRDGPRALVAKGERPHSFGRHRRTARRASRARAIPAPTAARPGDLYVDVHVSPDARFGRRGRHVTTTVHVPVTQAILGTTVEVPTLDEPVTLKVTAGTQSATTMRVRGRGVPASGQERRR
jgi:molecular chaperone DnaJ